MVAGSTPSTTATTRSPRSAPGPTKWLQKIRVGRGLTAIAISPDGRRHYVANARDDTVSAIDTATSQLAAKEIKVGHRPTAIAVSPVSKRPYVTGLEPGSVLVINTKANKPVAKPDRGRTILDRDRAQP